VSGGVTTDGVDPSWLKPFGSFLILDCVASAPSPAVEQLVEAIKTRLRRRRGGTATVVQGELQGTVPLAETSADAPAIEQVAALVYRVERPPSWGTADAPYMDTRHELMVVLRYHRFVAVHGDQSLRDGVLRWLDNDPPPPFRRVSRSVLQGAFLRGAARGLWLHGTHARRSTKPDSENLSGQSLADALNAFSHSTFALNSVRALVPDDGSFAAITGVIGTTPRKSLVWNGPNSTFADFIAITTEALRLVEETIALSRQVERPYPLLAAEVDDLTSVHSAYEISSLAPEDLSAGPDASEDMLAAAESLQRALLEVHGAANAPHFDISVGVSGAIVGTVRCTVRQVRNRVVLRFGFQGEPSDPASARLVLDALNHHDLLTIYYASGHSIHGGSIFLPRIHGAAFPRWEFEDFDNFRLITEKPEAASTAELHERVGSSADDSLFGWTVRQYSSGGWLTCDDGPGEVADFVHLDNDGTLRLIHVKAAHSESPARQVSASAYEVVASQASKNIGFLDVPTLRDRLDNPGSKHRATWHNGFRAEDRQGLVAALATRSPIAPLEVVIIQPHLAEGRYRYLQAQGGSLSEDALRLERLESLLNSCRGAITGVGGDLVVIASTR
jgi:hypothetical protein